jgi:hypothetical protein
LKFYNVKRVYIIHGMMYTLYDNYLLLL